MKPILSRHAALLLFAVVVAVWGSNWAVTKIVVQSVSPLWASAIRSAIATVALLALLLARGQLALPRRGDVPVILTVAILHMGAFAVLVAFGLQLVPVGRSIVLGYTTPLWVAPAAWLLLREPVTRSRLAGVGLGLAGLAIMFNPLAFDWSDRNALIGNGLILLAALCWAANILYVRAHQLDIVAVSTGVLAGAACHRHAVGTGIGVRRRAADHTGRRSWPARFSTAGYSARRWRIGRW